MNRFTVSQVNGFIKKIFSFEEIFYGINVEGEISNFKYTFKGHMYFTLKDEKSSISCVFFKEQADSVSFMPKNGMFVVVCGDVGIYEAYGKYQIYGFSLKQSTSENTTEKKLEKLKQKLLKEGLFNLSNKKNIPKLPNVVGVVAAKSGAAVEDVLKTFKERFPLIKINVYFALMQGESSVNSILKALKLAKKDKVDVLILARGGGSKEDLKVFDDEKLVRFICSYKIPVVSAIGHETDWSIVDLVSDFRASTPSSAVLAVCPDFKELLEKILNYKMLFKRFLKNVMNEYYYKLNMLKKNILLFSPLNNIINFKQKLLFLKKKFNYLIYKQYIYYENLFKQKKNILKSLNPKAILEKGYLYVVDENDKKVKTIKKEKVGNILKLYLKDGIFKVKIVEKIYNKN